MTTHDTTTTRPDPVYRLEGQLQEMKVIGPVADGLRMNGHFAGAITFGELAGARFELVDYFRIRSDGTGIVNAEEVLELDDQRIAVTVHGYVHPPAGVQMPTIDEILAPGFAFPDLPSPIEAFATFQTAAPSLAHLNTTVVGHTGSVNFATGALFVEAWRIGPQAAGRNRAAA